MLEGGLPAWQEQGLPVDTAAPAEGALDGAAKAAQAAAAAGAGTTAKYQAKLHADKVRGVGSVGWMGCGCGWKCIKVCVSKLVKSMKVGVGIRVGDKHDNWCGYKHQRRLSRLVWISKLVLRHAIVSQNAQWRRQKDTAGAARSMTCARSPCRPHLQVRSVEQMLEIVGGGCSTEQVVDARPAGRFKGWEPEPRAALRGGHMPGSRNVPIGQVQCMNRHIVSAIPS